jgi:heme exporter protein A
MALTVAELSVDRAGYRVIAGLSFEVLEGEARTLTGPNGAGKTTLLRALAGLLPPASGRICLDGIDPVRDPDGYVERLAYAGHLDAIKPQLTVAENLRFWADLHGAPDISSALDALDLAPIAGRPAHACSAGQKRRVGLARLLLAPRRLWLLDEPTASLDADAAACLTALVRAHCRNGGMAFVATHAPLDLGRAAPLALARQAARPAGSATDPFLAGAWT